MTAIPFNEARFFDPQETSHMVKERLIAFLRKLRVADLSAPIPESDEDDEHAPCHSLAPRDDDRREISRRARRLLDLREAASEPATSNAKNASHWSCCVTAFV
ncbi:hypothetical protein [Paracoccus ravus]|uniref:hypothetical protein n=1 Tax=Paracoccus ravus TaxID=2447760 RepID=UPI00106EB8F7|nr:hypothetical protein [Paracoccus ravus]